MRAATLAVCAVTTAIVAGCSISPTVDMASTEYVAKRRDTHSDITDAAEAWICRGISIFEWTRRYGTAERASGWRAMCQPGAELPPQIPTAAALGVRG